MIEEVSRGEWEAFCDECSYQDEYEGSTFQSIIDQMKDDRWWIHYTNGEWIHTCPDCCLKIVQNIPVHYRLWSNNKYDIKASCGEFGRISSHYNPHRMRWTNNEFKITCLKCRKRIGINWVKRVPPEDMPKDFDPQAWLEGTDLQGEKNGRAD